MSTPFYLIKLLATAKQLIRRNFICCLKSQVTFHSGHRDSFDSSPPPVSFHSLFKVPLSPLHKKAFIKKGLLEQMEGVNDNASAFMHPNIKTNK